MFDHTMPLYIVLHNDRHHDPDVQIFAQYDNAVAYARATAQRLAAHPAYITEHTFGPDDPADENHWFFIEYSPEEDGLAIMTRWVREGIGKDAQ
jgi:hypothetical protein